MLLMVLCGTAVLAGLVLTARWGGLEVRAAPPASDVWLRYFWFVAVAMVAGAGAGLLMAGPGGRLAMRLLAATAGDDAQGRLTEADETVGRITTGGTIGFVVFAGLFFGMATGVLYVVLHRWLPRRRLGGLAFGGILLVIAAIRVDPLRSDNPDFDLVGPGWLALIAFAALVVVHGLLVAAIAGRLSRSLPLLGTSPWAMVGHAPLLLLVPGAVIGVPVLLGAVVVTAINRRPQLVERLRSRAVLVWGRVVLLAVAAVSLPGTVAAIVDIAGRGP